jgi:hypothetical protein
LNLFAEVFLGYIESRGAMRAGNLHREMGGSKNGESKGKAMDDTRAGQLYITCRGKVVTSAYRLGSRDR